MFEANGIAMLGAFWETAHRRKACFDLLGRPAETFVLPAKV